jgi:hypothetical protein
VAFCPGVEWLPFSWEAFATLATGFAAVFAAWLIGKRQTDILARQIADAREASERDFKLREQTLRVELLNHRYEMIDEIRRIWGQWQQDGVLSDDDWNALRKVFHRAQLLYPAPIVDSIAMALKELTNHKREQARADQHFEGGRDEVAQKHLEKSFEADDAVISVMDPLLFQVLESSKVII